MRYFPWWGQMLGATMTAHSAIVPGTAKVADRKDPSGAALPDRWTRTEEWYNFTRSVRRNAHVLVTADESTYDPGSSRMGADHPISWCRNVEGSRLWATAMGHQASSYSEPLFREHVKGGVESADCDPTAWSSFEKIALDETTIAPGAVDIAPDGRVFFTEYGGKLKIYKPDTRTTVTAATLNVYGGGQNSEDGLTGLALDPDFATTGWVYLSYSPGSTTEEAARISRFTVNGDALDLSTEFFTGSSGARVVSQAGAESGDISDNDWISFKPVNFTGIDQVSFKVSSPTGGGSVELRSGSPTGPVIASAPVVDTGDWDAYVSTPPVNVTKPGGTVELFVVFKSSVNNNFDLDSITYIGPGVGSGGGSGAKEIVGVGGKCVDVNGGASTDGAKVQLWTCNGQANQEWTQTGSTFRTLDKCLDVNGGSQVDGTLVQLWSCNGSPAQNWSVQSDGTIRNGAKCLDATGGSSADGAQLIIWTCTGGTNQRWTLR